ncbi:hypothetical protein RRG08_001913 [Elysia crispata]|uniref:Uncharacterized protein n=1 Tax=Elysia crispata TaxID=231223 RepID=A0AAE1EDF5_9GAST|nr:hypothetical protein RRG08_001913 [Elysia crispata]
MKKLADYFPTLTGPEREEQFSSEVRQYHLCQNLSPSDEVQLDHWRRALMNTSQGLRTKKTCGKKTTAHKKAEEQIAAITNNNKKRTAEDISLLEPPAPKRWK